MIAGMVTWSLGLVVTSVGPVLLEISSRSGGDSLEMSE